MHQLFCFAALGHIEHEGFDTRRPAGGRCDLAGEIDVDVGHRQNPTARHQLACDAFADHTAATGQEREWHFGPRRALPNWGIRRGVVGMGQHVGDLIAGWKPDEVIMLVYVADHLLEGVCHVGPAAAFGVDQGINAPGLAAKRLFRREAA
jgi:hypothetical protein